MKLLFFYFLLKTCILYTRTVSQNLLIERLSLLLYELRRQKTGLRGFRPGPTQTRLRNQLNEARNLKFQIKEVEGLYYPCSENKGADQLRGKREADLRVCFRICKNPVFSRRGSII